MFQELKRYIWSRIKCLQSPEQIKWQVKLFLWGSDVHVALKKNYDESYGLLNELNPEDVCMIRVTKSSIFKRPSDGNDEPLALQNDFDELEHARQDDRKRSSVISVQSYLLGARERSGRMGSIARNPFSIDAQTREDNFLDYSKLLEAIRLFANFWWVYMVLRYVAIEHTSSWIERALKLNRPVHCYLMGRFIINESFSNMISGLIAFLHVFWRVCMRMSKQRYKLTALHFLLINQQELDSFYKQICLVNDPKLQKLDAKSERDFFALQPSIALGESEAFHLKPREQFILDTMCFRVKSRNEVIYTLRSSRTPRELARMRRMVVILLFFATSSHLILLLLAIPYSLARLGSDQRYLRVYNACDAQLELLNNANRLAPDSITLTRNHLTAIVFDLIETLVVWVDGGLVTYFGFCLLVIVNYDLIIGIAFTPSWINCRRGRRRAGIRVQYQWVRRSTSSTGRGTQFANFRWKSSTSFRSLRGWTCSFRTVSI